MDADNPEEIMEYPKPEPRITREEALKIADDEFSLLMRAYHASEDGFVRCCTCGELMEWYGTGVAQWGHYMKRQYMWTRWDVTNGGVQCEGCNVYGDGMPEQMRACLVARFGEAEVERLETEHKRMLQVNVFDILELSKSFKEKRMEIMREKKLVL